MFRFIITRPQSWYVANFYLLFSCRFNQILNLISFMRRNHYFDIFSTAAFFVHYLTNLYCGPLLSG